MKKKLVCNIDKNNKKYRKMRNSRFSALPKAAIICVIFLFIIYILDDVLNADLEIIFGTIYLFIIICAFLIIFAIKDVILLSKIGNSFIVVENNDIFIVYCPNFVQIFEDSLDAPKMQAASMLLNDKSNISNAIGAGIAAKTTIDNVKKKNKEELEDSNIANNDIDINRIIDDPLLSYDYYKNVKLIKETSNKYIFTGDKICMDGKIIKNKKFKIPKMYLNFTWK